MPVFSRKIANIRRMYTATLRRELGVYPTWPAGSLIELGDIGVFDRRQKAFSWETDLEALGVSVETVSGVGEGDELFTSHDGTDYDVTVDAQVATADFSFKRSGAVVTQTVGLGVEEITGKFLKKHLAGVVASGNLEWDYDWRVVTRLYKAETATILVHHGRGGRIKLGARVPVTVSTFNIADAGLGIGVQKNSGRIWKRIARKTPTPWFETHYLQRVNDKIILHRD